MSKPILWLDAECRKMHCVPEDDPDGRKHKLWRRVVNDYHYHDSDCPEIETRMLRWIKKFKKEWKWREIPTVMENIVLLGRGAAMRGYGRKHDGLQPTAHVGDEHTPTIPDNYQIGIPEKTYSCHPETFAKMTSEQQAHFDVREMKPYTFTTP